jgi:hypothetical protein
MIQQSCRNCGAPLQPEDAVCASCGMPIADAQPAATPYAPSQAPAAESIPQQPRAPRAAQPASGKLPRRRVFLLALLGTLVLVLFLIIGTLVTVLGNGSSATQQPPTTGAHITSIQTGTGFDTAKSMVTGATRTFKTGQAVFVVFVVKNQDANAKVVLKLLRGDTLESTSGILTPDIGTNTYAFPIVVHSTGAHTCQLDYNNKTEASISFNVAL